MAILRQENHLTMRLTVRDLVAFGRFPHSGGRPTVEDQATSNEALAQLDLLPMADKFVDELSGGQRQRAFIAMVLAQDTEYLLLDEPLNNLDMKHSVEMMRLLRRLADELGKTVVLVIHDINFASCYSDTILAMQRRPAAPPGHPGGDHAAAGAARRLRHRHPDRGDRRQPDRRLLRLTKPSLT